MSSKNKPTLFLSLLWNFIRLILIIEIKKFKLRYYEIKYVDKAL